MKKKQVKKIEKKNVRLSLKITKETSGFLAKEKLSPQRIFDLAIDELKAEK